ncbi:hypothetical protein J2Y63_002903 [Shinella sp. BE166]|uniref:hypothetical protein n=1 Tax=Shinella sp. BE166 TaxID=3373918 RepID=UPI003EBC1A0E
MTEKALVKRVDLLRMARVAKELGVVVSLEQDGVTIRVSPFDVGNPETIDAQLPARLASPLPPEPIKPPLNYLETAVMETLIGCGVGVGVAFSAIRSLGPQTKAKLVKRGYITVTRNPDVKGSDDEISLTAKGRAHWNAMEKYNKTYPRL